MVWVINNSSNKVAEVALGSKEMLAAKNVYLSRAEAIKAHQVTCPHKTWLGHSGTGAIFCADCNKTFPIEAGEAL